MIDRYLIDRNLYMCIYAYMCIYICIYIHWENEFSQLHHESTEAKDGNKGLEEVYKQVWGCC
jgi:hypothetical protein